MVAAKPKRQLHSSHLSMLSRCGQQFKFVFIDGKREPPVFPQIVGKSVHDVASKNLKHKVSTGGELMPIEQVQDLARDSFLNTWTSSPVILSEAEKQRGLEAVKGSGIDRSVAMSVLHATVIAPKVNPKPDGIERPWVIEAKGYPYDLAGQIDLDEVDNTIRDLKTGARMINQKMADTSEQLSWYSWAKYIIDKVMPPKVVLDCVTMNDAGETRTMSFESVRTKNDFAISRNRFERAIEVIEKGAFVPADPSDWRCSKRFCGFAAAGTCPFFNSGRSITVSMQKKERVSHVKSAGAKVIAAGSEAWLDAVR